MAGIVQHGSVFANGWLQCQLQCEAGTFVAVGACAATYLAAVALGNRAHQRQPQTHAATAFAGAGQAVKRLKNALALCHRHARAVVAHLHDGVRGTALQLQLYCAVAVAAGVFQQVAQRAAQQLGLARQL